MKEEIEELEVEELDVETKPEKIEIVEHVESKFDDIKPRTEMAEMSKEEKEEIKREVLDNYNPKETNKSSEEKPPAKKTSLFKILLILTLILIVGVIVFTKIILPAM